jgi:hypothetical protein
VIDDFNADRTGWARFSDDRRLRYRLSRAITPLGAMTPENVGLGEYAFVPTKRVVFVMLNPSTADAFKLDNTVTKCVQFAQRWGADVLEVVNIFALRSTDPKGLDAALVNRGDGRENDREILAACTSASRVIAAWGNHAHRGDRGAIVRNMLTAANIKLEHLGTTNGGFPLHPLARGKAFIPLTREPQVWT